MAKHAEAMDHNDKLLAADEASAERMICLVCRVPAYSDGVGAGNT